MGHPSAGLRDGRCDARVADIGEFELIARLGRLLERRDTDPLQPPASGEIGIGDDAALWTPAAGQSEVLTTDALVDGVHFRISTTSWRDLGWKALAENVSDVAAMGARPCRAFVTLGLPKETRVADLEDLYRGMQDLATEYGFRIAGGDTVSSPITFVSVAVVGSVSRRELRRATGVTGDVLAVTGSLGASAGGLELLETGLTAPRSEDEATLIHAHRRPRPRVREALTIAEAGITCGMDLSDGLIGDSQRLGYASGVGVEIDWERIPVSPALERTFGRRARETAAAGGEDYELLVAGPNQSIKRANAALEAAGLAPLTIVGRLTLAEPGSVRVLDREGRELSIGGGSWQHFGSPER